MLIPAPSIKTGDVVSFKIANGDELLAKVVEIDVNVVTVTKPCQLLLAQDSRGQPGIQMVPMWMLGADPSARYPINRSHIVCMVLSNKDATNGYLQQTSGLTIPGSSGLIT